MNKYIFVRHGQSTVNLKKVIGSVSDVPLTQKGIDQAKHTGELLKQYQIDFAICSSLMRAKQTFEEIQKINNIQEVYYSDQIIERNYGIFEGKPYDYMDSIPEGLNFWNLKENVQVEGAESVQFFKQKIQNFFKEVTQKYNGKTILLVAHGGVYRIIDHIINNPQAINLMTIAKNAEIFTFEM